jgi:hypothetical protein
MFEGIIIEDKSSRATIKSFLITVAVGTNGLFLLFGQSLSLKNLKITASFSA